MVGYAELVTDAGIGEVQCNRLETVPTLIHPINFIG